MKFIKEISKKKYLSERRILNFVSSLMKFDLPLMKSIFTSLAKRVLMLLGLTEVASATDAAIENKVFLLVMNTLIISN